MTFNTINIKEKFSMFSKYWSPRIISEMNDYQFKLVKIKGEFIWHEHKDTDEVFIVIEGSINIEFQDGIVTCQKGKCLSFRKVLHIRLLQKMNVK